MLGWWGVALICNDLHWRTLTLNCMGKLAFPTSCKQCICKEKFSLKNNYHNLNESVVLQKPFCSVTRWHMSQQWSSAARLGPDSYQSTWLLHQRQAWGAQAAKNRKKVFKCLGNRFVLRKMHLLPLQAQLPQTQNIQSFFSSCIQQCV